MAWRSAYLWDKDESISSYGGFETIEAAIAEARTNLAQPGITYAWVRSDEGNIVWHSEDGFVQC